MLFFFKHIDTIANSSLHLAHPTPSNRGMERADTRAGKMSTRKSSPSAGEAVAPKTADLSSTPSVAAAAAAPSRRSNRKPAKRGSLTAEQYAPAKQRIPTTLSLGQVYVLLAVLLVGMFVLSAALLAYVDRRLPPAELHHRTTASLEEDVRRQVETILSDYWKSNIDKLSADLLAHARRAAPELR